MTWSVRAQITVTIPGPPPLTALEDMALEVPFSVKAEGVVPDSLRVSARLLSENLATVDSVSFDGTNGVARVVPRQNAVGLAYLWITARAQDLATGSTLMASNQVNVRWTAVNDTPQISWIADRQIEAGQLPLAIPLTVQDAESSLSFTFAVTADRPELFSALGVVNPGNPYLKLASTNVLGGHSRVTVAVWDFQGGSNQVSFSVQVLPSDWQQLPNLPLSTTNAQFVDFDADGFQDLAYRSVPGVKLWRNLMGEGFADGGLSPASLTPAGVIEQWADVDGDSKPDFLVARPSGSFGGSVYRQTSSATELAFTPITNSVPRHVEGGLAWADFDEDGDLDFVGGGNAQGQLQPINTMAYHGGVYTNQANGFAWTQTLPICGDFTGDGLPDVLISDEQDIRGLHLLWQNLGGWRFIPATTGIWVNRPVQTGAVDFDGDGRLDVWAIEGAATALENNTLMLWRNTPTGFELTAQFESGAGRTATVPVWGDLDGDGDLDFIFPRLSTELTFISPQRVVRTTNHVVYENNGDGYFRAGSVLGSYVGSGWPAIGDLNRDGSLDVWLPGNGRQLLKQTRRFNHPPGTPTGLQAFVTGQEVVFLWNETTDPNQTAALTYNLRVGTSPGTNDVIASQSLADGTRQLPAPGNNGFLTHHRLVLLPREFAGQQLSKLYWSVQAVDNSYAGGAWAPEQSVDVTLTRNEPPVVEGLPDTLTIGTSGVDLAFTVRDALTPFAGLTYRLLADHPKLVQTQESPVPFPTFSVSPPKVLLRVRLRPDALDPVETMLSLVVTDYAGLATTNRIKLELDNAIRGRLITRQLPDGGLRVFAVGRQANLVRIEMSSNLRDWTPWGQVRVFTTNEQELFSVPPLGSDEEPKFYRMLFP